MSRRKSTGDQEFGSDSFLDIIANIVGILIILIVVAGVKVARQPADVPQLTTEAATQTATSAPAADRPSPPAAEPRQESSTKPVETQAAQVADSGFSGNAAAHSDVVDARAAEAVVADQESAQELAEAIDSLTEPPVESDELAELDRQIAGLEIELDQTQTSSGALQTRLAELLHTTRELHDRRRQVRQQQTQALDEDRQRLEVKVSALQASLARADSKNATFQSTLASLNNRQSYLVKALKQVAMETQQLREVLEAADAATPETSRLNHRLSPVGQSVTSAELHFRLHNGRIAHVPIEGLLERMKDQVSARRSVVMRFHRYEGVAGPVGGFMMKYVVQRESMRPLQALQYGNSAYRVTVSRWTILPADTLSAEPVEAALRIGSRFRQILEATDTDTTVTIWLYPPDFGHFSDLRELAHGLNLRVAARPLPEGTPIAGSPNGSRSTSQ
ncbi:MAG: hypothetical protein RIK87_01215 [Fuerstiella sp.]